MRFFVCGCKTAVCLIAYKLKFTSAKEGHVEFLYKAFYAVLLTGDAFIIFMTWMAIVFVLVSSILLSVRRAKFRYIGVGVLISVALYFGGAYLVYPG